MACNFASDMPEQMRQSRRILVMASFHRQIIFGIWYCCALTFVPRPLPAQQLTGCAEQVFPLIRVDSGHPWRPPFGLDRVGGPVAVHVELTAPQPPSRQYSIVAYRDGRELSRESLSLQQNPAEGQAKRLIKGQPPYFATVRFNSLPAEVALYARCPEDGRVQEIKRQSVSWPEIEAEAIVRADHQINPVDLGTILVPHDWLLLGPGQTAVVHVAVVSRTRDLPSARLRAWFADGEPLEVDARLLRNQRFTQELKLPLTSRRENTTLHVRLTDGGHDLWKKEIRTMVVAATPRWPAFGAVETQLRYDTPVVVSDPKTGEVLPSLDYQTAWDPKLKDVIVFLPNGSRMVFWRGASYIPFWAGRYNTGVSYQWAENLAHPVPHPDGTVDFREPMFDAELRYGRVRIVESTPSRVHVRWTYQLTDLQYTVGGDQATEDFYFYPDGFGTRVITLSSVPGERYQLTEFIIVTPQSAFPLDVLPSHMADVLFLDGENKHIRFPLPPPKESTASPLRSVTPSRQLPMVVRVFPHKDDREAAIYFDPQELTPPFTFAPFHDRGELVTPVYWGSHWPLGRGKWTGWTINDRIHSNPAHNSLLGYGFDFPKPLFRRQYPMPDTLGQVQPRLLQRWAGLIAKTDAADNVLVQWAQSFSDPPSLEVSGARINFPSYSQERRAIRLVAESSPIEIGLKPARHCMNPVFELEGAPGRLTSLSIDGKPVTADAYTWDGATLWVKASIGTSGVRISVRFQ